VRGPKQRQETRYQRYVGVELAVVLEEIQRVHGIRANIVSVDRVRHGGFGGFFARESYEVLVDASAPAPAGDGEPDEVLHALEAAPPAELSFTDLLARRIEEEERRELREELAGRLRTAPPTPAARPEAALPTSTPSPGFGNRASDDSWFEPDDDGGAIDEADWMEVEPGDCDEPDESEFSDRLPVAVPPCLPLAPPCLPVASGPRPASVDGWTTGDRLLPATDSFRPQPRPNPAGSQGAEFWARYDRAQQEAELLAIPAVALSAIVGRLELVAPVVERHQRRHWAGWCEVVVLTDRPQAQPDWRVVSRHQELVALIEAERGEFPLLVIDVAPQLPSWLRPVLDSLRQAGLGLVHYVLDGDPSDEDLATWHGEIGRPAVLDLVAPIPPTRVLELIDRGEPLASIGGVPVSADLLFALGTEVSCAH
jgi:hypothetical protein